MEARDEQQGATEPIDASIRALFERLIARDASGRLWLPALLAASPRGRERLGELAAEPGSLVMPLTVRGASGVLGCFDYLAPPARELLAWFVDHPDRLTWPLDTGDSPAEVKLRRALVADDPPGARVKAQERARELLLTRSALSEGWWRFEGIHRLDCVLITPRLVVTVHAGSGMAPATDWYPERVRLVRDLEAARLLADGRAWGSLMIDAAPAELDAAELVAAGAPHLGASEHEDLASGYLGTMGLSQAREAVAAAVGEDAERR